MVGLFIFIFVKNQEVKQASYAGSNVIFINNSLISKMESKFFKYLFEVEFLGGTLVEVSNSVSVSRN